MSTRKASLEANQSEILAALPKEFHEEFLKEVAETTDDAPLSEADEVAAIKAELVANPSVDEAAAAAELKEVKAPGKVAPLSEAETAAEMEARLKEAQAGY